MSKQFSAPQPVRQFGVRLQLVEAREFASTAKMPRTPRSCALALQIR